MWFQARCPVSVEEKAWIESRMSWLCEQFGRDRLRQQLKDEGLDALLVSNPTNVTYLTGFSGDSSFLILGRQRAVLVSDGRFTGQLAEECPGLETVIRQQYTAELE